MNNRFKFRVWSFLDKDFHYFSIGDGEDGYPQGISFGVSKIQQYTGVIDRNGKDIYDGDIIKYHQDYVFGNTVKKDYKFFLAEIIWSNCSYLILRKNIRDSGWVVDSSINLHENLSSHIEVVGNIFENKDLYAELLNKEQTL